MNQFFIIFLLLAGSLAVAAQISDWQTDRFHLRDISGRILQEWNVSGQDTFLVLPVDKLNACFYLHYTNRNGGLSLIKFLVN